MNNLEILNQLYSNERTGTSISSKTRDPRSDFQRDFDRIIFSSAFRRLQNKTQVFPLPGSVFVHNRLTHSLEVASVGRSLGHLAGQFILGKYKDNLDEKSIEFYDVSLPYVIASACLCHDIGNPAFGHSGEDAISHFFKSSENLQNQFTYSEWCDLTNFEGNANAIRILTRGQKNKPDGGMRLTYSTLSAIAKYPCQSSEIDKKVIYRKKFGFFISEKDTFKTIAEKTNMQLESNDPLIYRRHPFVWLVELADDICYNIIDFEDAHRLKIISDKICEDMLMEIIKQLKVDEIKAINKQLKQIVDTNEKISYLRAKSMNALITKGLEIYDKNFEDFLNCSIEKNIFDNLADEFNSIKELKTFSKNYIYNNRKVVEIENAGYSVMKLLLNYFVYPIIKDESIRDCFEKKSLQLLPDSFNYDNENKYNRVMGIIDYISGMTDNYAVDLYKKINGTKIELSY